jgi:hypothetical protein
VDFGLGGFAGRSGTDRGGRSPKTAHGLRTRSVETAAVARRRT